MNATHTEHRKRFGNATRWISTGNPGVEKRVVVPAGENDGQEVSVIRLKPGTHLPAFGDDLGIEALVLEGSCEFPEGTLVDGGYTRRPPGTWAGASTVSGCTLYVRTLLHDGGARDDGAGDIVHAPEREDDWFPGHGNLQVRSLRSAGHDSSALVYWPGGERFVPHRHWGGEEIFVLAGTFRDEHGTYPQGTWIQSPHLSAHDPYVEEDTVIFVRTGHLLPNDKEHTCPPATSEPHARSPAAQL